MSSLERDAIREVERLRRSLHRVQKSIPASESCKSIVDFVTSTPYPSSIQATNKALSKSKSVDNKLGALTTELFSDPTRVSRSAPVSPTTSYTSLPSSSSFTDFGTLLRSMLPSSNVKRGLSSESLSEGLRSSNSSYQDSLRASTESNLDSDSLASTPPAASQLSTCGSFTYLPEELLYGVFSLLDHKSLVMCHLVCHRWQRIIEDQSTIPHPMKQWNWEISLYFYRNTALRAKGDPLVHGFFGTNPWTKAPKSNKLSVFRSKKSEPEDVKNNKVIEKDIEVCKQLFDIIINLVLIGDDTAKTLFKSNLHKHCSDMEDDSSPGMLEHKLWYESRTKTPLRIIDMAEKQDTSPRSRRKWSHMFEDSLAVIVCLNIGDYDTVYKDKNGSGNALVYHYYYKLIKEFLGSKFLTFKPVILVLYRGEFDAKIHKALKEGTGEDISILFPEYKAREGPRFQADYMAQKLVSWCNSKRRVRCISKYFTTEDDENLLAVLQDTVRHCVIQRRAYKLGLGTI